LAVSDRKRLQRPVIAAAAPEAGPSNGGSGASRQRALKLGVLDEHLGYFVRRVQVWIFQDFIRTLARENIRPAQYSVLAVIEANPGLSQSGIAGFLGIERARFVRLIDRLEKRGLVERRAAPGDRRSHALYLTREGQKSLKRIKALASRHETNLAAKFGAERHKLLLELLREFGS
jgi:DNA-binding MarR family transcriptional regulator